MKRVFFCCVSEIALEGSGDWDTTAGALSYYWIGRSTLERGYSEGRYFLRVTVRTSWSAINLCKEIEHGISVVRSKK